MPLGEENLCSELSKCQTYIALSFSNPASFIFQGPYAYVLFTSVPPPPLPSYPMALFLCPLCFPVSVKQSRVVRAELLGPSENPRVHRGKVLLMRRDF